MKEHFEERSFFDTNRVKGSGLIRHMTRIENLINIPITYFSDNESDSNLIFSLTNSNNIKNQKGVFTWNANTFKPLEMLGNEQYDVSRTENDSEDYRFSGCYNINKKLVPYIKQQLEKDGITKLSDDEEESSFVSFYYQEGQDAKLLYFNVFFKKDGIEVETVSRITFTNASEK